MHDRERDYQVTVLEPLFIREHPIAELAGRMGQMLVLALPLLALLTWLSIRHGLRPLMGLSDAIGARDAINLEAIQFRMKYAHWSPR